MMEPAALENAWCAARPASSADGAGTRAEEADPPIAIRSMPIWMPVFPRTNGRRDRPYRRRRAASIQPLLAVPADRAPRFRASVDHGGGVGETAGRNEAP